MRAFLLVDREICGECGLDAGLFVASVVRVVELEAFDKLIGSPVIATLKGEGGDELSLSD